MREIVERRAALAISAAALLIALLYASHYDRKVAALALAHALEVAARDKACAEDLGELRGRFDASHLDPVSRARVDAETNAELRRLADELTAERSERRLLQDFVEGRIGRMPYRKGTQQ